jgi:cytochrome c-type biogenesis protein CcmF
MRTRGENFPVAVLRLVGKNKRRYGGYIVHLSIVMMFAGFAGNAFNKEATRQMETGQQLEIGDYTLKMAGYREGVTPDYDFGKVALDVSRNGKFIRTLMPERRVFKNSGQATTTVGLHSTPREDLYVIFAGMSQDKATFEIKAYVKPLVFWIWFGAATMIFGTIITLLPDRRQKTEVRR